MRSETTKVVGLVGAILAAACGDEATPDARITQPPIDATVNPPDAADPTIDAGAIDAPPAKPSFTGTISFQEVDVQGIAQLGQGIQVTISYTNDETSVAPLMEEMPGSPLGCKVWSYTTDQAADVGLDQGAVTFTTGDGDPAMPPCVFVAGRGYLCIGESDAGGAIALVDAGSGLWSFTDEDAAFTAADIGRTLSISGATAPVNNDSFPIVSYSSATTVVFASGVAQVPETLPAAATWLVVAGTGPNPAGASLPDGFLEDDDSLSVTLTSGGDGNVETFTRNFTDVGDDFTLDTQSQTTINAIPTDGSAFTIGCDGAGGTCGSATGSVLTITTTDGAIPVGAASYDMPSPAATEVSIRCATIGGTSLTVPTEFSAFIMNSGATRIQTTFLRSALQSASNSDKAPADAETTIVAGHGTVGFTTP